MFDSLVVVVVVVVKVTAGRWEMVVVGGQERDGQGQ